LKYPERIQAAKYLYRRLRRKGKDSEDTLLLLVELCVAAGINRSNMQESDAVNDWLTRLVKPKTREKLNEKLYKRDKEERNMLLTQKRQIVYVNTTEE